MTYTAKTHADAVKRARGLRFRQLIDTGHGSGVVLSTRGDSPGVLGFGAVDTSGKLTALGLTVDEAEELRNALNDWIEEARG